MHLEIRPVRPQEYQAVGELIALAYQVEGAPSGKDDPYLDTLSDVEPRTRTSVVLVALADGVPAGAVTWCPLGSTEREIARDDEGEFRTMAVHPDYRGRGIARALVTACLDLARAEGFSGVAISSTTWMTKAHRLYRSMGFERDPGRDWSPVPVTQLLAFRKVW